MADETEEIEVGNPTLAGRRTIYTSAYEITDSNVISEVNNALVYHLENLKEEEYLYWYRRGIEPVLNRTKEVHKDINNKIVENHADEIVSFKNGYFLTQPAHYVARNDESIAEVEKLNEYLYRSGKTFVDNDLVDWFHTVGKAALYVRADKNADTPVKAYCLDPRSAFVVYSLMPGNEPMYGVNIVVSGSTALIDVYTKEWIFRLTGGAVGTDPNNLHSISTTATSIRHIEVNPLGYIPIIEYQYNTMNMCAFENAIPLLNAINTVSSNRVDGVEQFIQSLAVATNCEFEDGVTIDQIRQAGMLLLKSTSENKAEFTILSEQLDQNQTQTLVDHMYSTVLRICGMPAQQSSSRGSFDATGQAILANNGWYQADTVARNTADLFIRANRQFDEIFLSILKRKGLVSLDIADFELQIVQNETSNIQSKAQAYTTLVEGGFHPILAMKKSGVSNDPTSDFAMSEKYLKIKVGDPDAADSNAKAEQPSNEDGDDQSVGKPAQVEVSSYTRRVE